MVLLVVSAIDTPQRPEQVLGPLFHVDGEAPTSCSERPPGPPGVAVHAGATAATSAKTADATRRGRKLVLLKV